MMARMAGSEIALDSRDLLDALRPRARRRRLHAAGRNRGGSGHGHTVRVARSLPLWTREDADAPRRGRLDDGSSEPRSDSSAARARPRPRWSHRLGSARTRSRQRAWLARYRLRRADERDPFGAVGGRCASAVTEARRCRAAAGAADVQHDRDGRPDGVDRPRLRGSRQSGSGGCPHARPGGRPRCRTCPRKRRGRSLRRHDRLMPAMAAVVGHGGLGTVLRALAHGVRGSAGGNCEPGHRLRVQASVSAVTSLAPAPDDLRHSGSNSRGPARDSPESSNAGNSSGRGRSPHCIGKQGFPGRPFERDMEHVRQRVADRPPGRATTSSGST
jgi:hypothetical protein